MMTDVTNLAIRPIDRMDRSIACMRTICSLIDTPDDLHLINGNDLCTTLTVITEQLEQALSELIAQDEIHNMNKEVSHD